MRQGSLNSDSNNASRRALGQRELGQMHCCGYAVFIGVYAGLLATTPLLAPTPCIAAARTRFWLGDLSSQRKRFTSTHFLSLLRFWGEAFFHASTGFGAVGFGLRIRAQKESGATKRFVASRAMARIEAKAIEQTRSERRPRSCRVFSV